MLKEIQDLAIILTLAALFGGLARLLRLPMIFAYLIAGACLAASGAIPEAATGLYRLFGELGVMFLLFLIGLEINYSSLRTVGPTALLVGTGQVVISGVFGILIALLLGFSAMTATYVGIMMAFASTVVVVKLLSEKRDTNSLHGKLLLGILLVQDFLAMIILVGMAGIQAGQGIDTSVVMLTVVKAILAFMVMLWIGRTIVPKILRVFTHAQELLFLGTLAWLFLVAWMTAYIGLSLEIGGFLAGIALANSSDQFHIAFRMRPLRDFFLVVLFVTLGTSLSLTHLPSIFWPVLTLSLAVLIINPVIVTVLLHILGYHRRTAILTGLHISQLSEFSLVVAVLGARLGHLDSTVVSIITISAIVTIGCSSFLMAHDHAVYRLIKKLFGWKESSRLSPRSIRSYDTILIGAHRLGHNILKGLGQSKVFIVDFDPDVINRLRREKQAAMYGDIGDEEVVSAVLANRPKVIISTSPDLEDNLALLEAVRTIRRPRPRMIVRAENEHEAIRLYKHGADFVLLPHRMSGISLGHALRSPKFDLLRQWRRDDVEYLSTPA